MNNTSESKLCSRTKIRHRARYRGYYWWLNLIINWFIF